MFEKNDRVIYIPDHGPQSLKNLRSQWGTVIDPKPRTSSQLIFVHFDGDTHPKAAPQRNLYKSSNLGQTS